jgi:hypothetical protein
MPRTRENPFASDAPADVLAGEATGRNDPSRLRHLADLAKFEAADQQTAAETARDDDGATGDGYHLAEELTVIGLPGFALLAPVIAAERANFRLDRMLRVRQRDLDHARSDAINALAKQGTPKALAQLEDVVMRWADVHPGGEVAKAVSLARKATNRDESIPVIVADKVWPLLVQKADVAIADLTAASEAIQTVTGRRNWPLTRQLAEQKGLAGQWAAMVSAGDQYSAAVRMSNSLRTRDLLPRFSTSRLVLATGGLANMARMGSWWLTLREPTALPTGWRKRTPVDLRLAVAIEAGAQPSLVEPETAYVKALRDYVNVTKGNKPFGKWGLNPTLRFIVLESRFRANEAPVYHDPDMQAAGLFPEG